jgi:hypothetical protein
MRSLLLLLGGVSACVLLGIGSILKMQTVSDLNDKELIVVVHAKLHGFTTSRAILEESLDSRVGDLDQMDQSVTSLIRDLKNADCPNAKSRRALLLEENILERVRELVVFRKSCEQSLHSATSDPLRENPLAGGIELQANQMPSAEGKSETVDQSVIAKRMEELKQQNAQVRSSDNTRRRNLFAAGARGRWAETSHRIKSQIFDDLHQLDGLLATAML